MRASVVVVSYNSLRYLSACLDSICAQMEPDDELIVVDNGSTDRSAGFVADNYPGVRLIRGDNAGYVGGNNRGAAIARGEYLVFLNPDTVLEPGALRALVAPLAGSSVFALATACIVYMDRPDVVNACGNTIQYTGLTYCRGANQPREHYRRMIEVDAVSGAAFAIRRSLFEELGGFDERFFMYVEDTDLSLRARLAGHRCLYVPDAVVRHDYRPSYSPHKAFYLDRNRHLMLLKNLRRSTYLHMLPALALAELVTWGFLLLNGPRYWGVKPRVYSWLWRNRGTLRPAQRETQQHGRGPDDELMTRMTHRLEFGQLASRQVARLAAGLFHPAFWAAQLIVAARFA